MLQSQLACVKSFSFFWPQFDSAEKNPRTRLIGPRLIVECMQGGKYLRPNSPHRIVAKGLSINFIKLALKFIAPAEASWS
jgi:hypothetical protein